MKAADSYGGCSLCVDSTSASDSAATSTGHQELDLPVARLNVFRIALLRCSLAYVLLEVKNCCATFSKKFRHECMVTETYRGVMSVSEVVLIVCLIETKRCMLVSDKEYAVSINDHVANLSR